jgi:signal transduction histidine kinase
VEDILHMKAKGKSLDIRMELEEIMRSINQKRTGIADDYTITNKSGMSFPAALTMTPLLQDGKLTGAIILFHDITKEREIDKAKNEFVSFVSHQLRTPLGSMRWNMEMLMEGSFGKIPDDATLSLSDMHKANQFLIDLVNQLLDISRIESGKIIDQPQAIDALDAIQAVVASLGGEAKARDIDIEVKSSLKNLLPIWVDPEGFRGVIQNLLANAIKYNKPAGKILIDVNKEDEYLTVKIADTGIGIPEEDQANVFSKFYRASNAASGSVQGTGLGLFMVKSFVERNKGKISFVSKEGQGTTFYISLPFFIENWHKE